MSDEKPFHLQGNFAPVTEEVTATDLEVVGSIPPELSGRYLRNGANPVTGESEHWFLGNGMIHGVRLEGGRAAWYRNRYVRTPYFDDPHISRISPEGVVDHTASAANTHVIGHGGRILALEEGAFPFELNGDLDTVGCHDFGGQLKTAMTAHPKICPVTGEMVFFGYAQFPPYLTYYRASPDGKIVQSEEITMGGPTMIHDFAMTRHHAIFMDLPVVFDLQLALQGTMPFKWSDDYPARVGIMPRDGLDADVKWFDVDPCYVFHTLNAFDDGDKVVVDACRISEIWREAGDMQGGTGDQSLHRWTFDLAGGGVKEETLDDRGMDFPRVADARVGLPHRFGYTVQFDQRDGQPSFSGLLKVDLERGASQLHSFGDRVNPGEPVFVPAAGSDSNGDDGWVMAYVHNEADNRTEFVILDASSFAAEPVARIPLPQRVPYGFHGSWIADA